MIIDFTTDAQRKSSSLKGMAISHYFLRLLQEIFPMNQLVSLAYMVRNYYLENMRIYEAFIIAQDKSVKIFLYFSNLVGSTEFEEHVLVPQAQDYKYLLEKLQYFLWYRDVLESYDKLHLLPEVDKKIEDLEADGLNLSSPVLEVKDKRHFLTLIFIDPYGEIKDEIKESFDLS